MSDLKQDAFGGNSNYNMSEAEMSSFMTSTVNSYGKNAYMLVYERKKKRSILQLMQGDEEVKIDASLDCANTAVSRAAEKDKKEVKIIEKDGEKLLELGFKDFNKTIPNWIEEEAKLDNNQFIREK